MQVAVCGEGDSPPPSSSEVLPEGDSAESLVVNPYIQSAVEGNEDDAPARTRSIQFRMLNFIVSSTSIRMCVILDGHVR